MGYLPRMSKVECICQLLEDGPGCPLGELFSLTDETEELAIFFDSHDIIEDSLNFSIRSTVNPSYIEVYDLN